MIFNARAQSPLKPWIGSPSREKSQTLKAKKKAKKAE
jgi:hypothetical protein